MMKFGLIVPTLNAGNQWRDWINAFDSQTVKPDRIVVIDSESSDNTAALARDSGFDVVAIKRRDFNHGATRQYGIDVLGDIDICVFMTQDAILSRPDSLNNILQPLQDGSVAAVCGRQLPRKLATQIEAHARLYNYSSKSSIRSAKDISKYGLKTAFISNSFAAYRVSTLNEVGGFPSNVIFGEDMYVAAKMLLAGYKIAYAADACVYHSHDYSLFQEMERYFDMGVFHAREQWIRKELGGAEGEGAKFVSSELTYLLKYNAWKIPDGILRTLFRYFGFRLGLEEKRLSRRFKSRLAMNKGYFK